MRVTASAEVTTGVNTILARSGLVIKIEDVAGPIEYVLEEIDGQAISRHDSITDAVEAANIYKKG